MNWFPMIRFMQHALVVWAIVPHLIVTSASSMQSDNGVNGSSQFVFKLLPMLKEGESVATTQSNSLTYTSKDIMTSDNLPDYDYTTYSDSWTDMTTDEESYPASTTVASDVISDNKTNIDTSGSNTSPTVPQTSSRRRFVFNIIRAPPTTAVTHSTKNSVERSSTTLATKIISRKPVVNPPTTRQVQVVTTSESLITDADLLPIDESGLEFEDGNNGDTYNLATSFLDYERTTDSNVTDTPTILLGLWPQWNDWYWILIALLILIILSLIVVFCCCLAKRRKSKRGMKNNKDAEKNKEDGSASACGSSASCDNSSGPTDQSPACSKKSSLSKDRRETDQIPNDNAPSTCRPTKHSQDVPVVITIPDPVQDAADKHYSPSSIRNEEYPPSPKYDARLEQVGNERIIYSGGTRQPPADPARKRDRITINGKTHTDGANRQRRPRHEKRRTERNATERNRTRKGLPKKSQPQLSRKHRRRGDTKAKLSDSTKSILEAARDLDGILAAITSLTQEYPIPEHPNTRKSERKTDKPQDTKSRRRRAKTSAHPEKNTRSRRVKDGQMSGKKLENFDERNRESSRSNKKRKRSKEKSKETEEKRSSSKKKVPTLIKEELPAVDAAKDEQRRRRLERDLKKLKNYHNTQFSDTS